MATESPNLVQITDSRDPRVAAFLSIRERDLTNGHGGRFIAEGKVTLDILLSRGRFEIDSVFVCETRLEPLAEILAGVPEGVPVYVARQSLMDAVAGFPVHRGVLACGRKGPPHSPGDVLPAEGVSTALILSDISNHDNVGACFRNAAAFGAGAVLLDALCCDPLYRKAIRVSSGAALWMPFAHGGRGADLISEAESRGYEVWALTPDAAAEPLPLVDVPDRVALLLGAEGPGLPRELMARARPVRIPMTDGFDSVNVATAAALALSHVFNARSRA